MAGGLARVGDEWEGYTVVEAVGQFGMAERYRARAPEGGIVLLDVLGIHHPELAQRLRAARLEDLSHPGLLTVREVIAVLRFPALVMDDSPGVPLEDWLQRQPPLEDRLAVFRSVVEALNVLHTRKLPHADLQPGSVLVEEDVASTGARLTLPGVAGVVFSLLRDGGSVTTSGAALGRPDYLAPERARKPELADTRSDMFSLGCMLYQIIAGRSPFAGLDRYECYMAARAEDFVPLDERVPDAPADMVRLCHLLLRAHPDARLQHCGEVVDRLEASGVTTPHPPPVVPVEPEPSRPLWPWALVAAVALGVVALGAWWMVG